MSLMFSLVYAGHARGSHHKLALDAVRRLRGPDADAWRRVFLKHAAVFVPAAKVPDDVFKDFKNHVLHPRDGYWGGAPLACRQWYDTFVSELRAANWEKAIYAAGVLSHYVADPIHPFHTAQSEAENAIHRACEWSINRAYDDLRAEGEAAFGALGLAVDTDPNWLTILVGRGADKSNGYYEKLIAHYDVNRGVVDPPAGLDPVARRIMAELVHYAAETIAVVFRKAFEEAGVAPPQVSVTAEMLLAAIRIPKNQLLKKMENAAERKLVAAMYDELKATGTVEATLPADDRAIRDIYAAEVVSKRQPVDIAAVFKAATVEAVAPDIGSPTIAPSKAVTRETASPPAMKRPSPATAQTPSPLPPESERKNREPATSVPSFAATDAPAAPIPPEAASSRSLPSVATPPEQPVRTGPAERKLALDADVVDAPSIGPKTAERLYAVGIRTVSDLLAADAGALASALQTRWIGTTTVADWQAQTRLATEIPGLRDTHTQLLVGAGYRDARTLADADPDTLAADVLNFALSAEGRRLLRDGAPPDIEKIKGWLERARTVLAA